jgi:hypothetical protein
MRLTPLLILLLAAALGGCAYPTAGRVSVGDERGRVDLAFSSQDRILIHDYYRRTLPPGLARKQSLPPGLQKQLVRRGHLPPGLEGQRLPSDLEGRLTPLPAGYVRLRIGTDVVLVEVGTRLILDLVSNVGG